ncbi:MAG: ribonuclease H-like domain-containing protein, partial [bacterium]
AVRLWFTYQRDGRREALERLIRYNLEDTRNLKVLMELAYEQLRKHTFPFLRDGQPAGREMD